MTCPCFAPPGAVRLDATTLPLRFMTATPPSGLATLLPRPAFLPPPSCACLQRTCVAAPALACLRGSSMSTLRPCGPAACCCCPPPPDGPSRVLVNQLSAFWLMHSAPIWQGAQHVRLGWHWKNQPQQPTHLCNRSSSGSSSSSSMSTSGPAALQLACSCASSSCKNDNSSRQRGMGGKDKGKVGLAKQMHACHHQALLGGWGRGGCNLQQLDIYNMLHTFSTQPQWHNWPLLCLHSCG
jgi:hypothetical protein